MTTLGSTPTSRPAQGHVVALRWWGRFSVSGLIFLIVGCGKPDTSSSASGPIDACALLTVDDAAAVLGSAVSPPQNEVVGVGDEGKAAVSQCTFTSESDPTKSVSLFVRRSPVADSTPERIRTSLSEFGAKTQDVDGIGDAALWDGTQLHVFRSQKSYVIITVSGFGGEGEALAKAKVAGEKAAARL